MSGCAKPPKGSFRPQNRFSPFSTHISMVLPVACQVCIAFDISGRPHVLTLGMGHFPMSLAVLACITPFTTFQCEEHIPSTPKSGPGIHPLHFKLRLYHLIGTLYMLGWVRMPESGLVQVASTTGHDLVFSHYLK